MKEEKLITALRELAGFAERNAARARNATKALKAKPHQLVTQREWWEAVAREHEADRIYFVIRERVAEALK